MSHRIASDLKPEPNPRSESEHRANSRKRFWPWLTIVAIVVLITIHFRVQGRSWWCACEQWAPLASNVNSSHNSQHLFDPYAFSHMLHGLIFYGAFTLAFPRLSLDWRMALSIGLEALWEGIENTEFVINRYRAATISLGYQGDTILNSLCDILSCGVGVLIARRLGWRKSVLLFAATEAIMLVWIRDSLGLNVLMLIYPLEAVKTWQAS